MRQILIARDLDWVYKKQVVCVVHTANVCYVVIKLVQAVFDSKQVLNWLYIFLYKSNRKFTRMSIVFHWKVLSGENTKARNWIELQTQEGTGKERKKHDSVIVFVTLE